MQIRQSEQTHGKSLALVLRAVLKPASIDTVILPASGKGVDVGDGKGVGPPKSPLDTEKLE